MFLDACAVQGLFSKQGARKEEGPKSMKDWARREEGPKSMKDWARKEEGLDSM
jgi:hypothetical protein